MNQLLLERESVRLYIIDSKAHRIMKNNIRQRSDGRYRILLLSKAENVNLPNTLHTVMFRVVEFERKV